MLIPHIEGDSLLIKHSLDDKINGHFGVQPKLVILAGNGCIEGGVLPLCKVLSEKYGKTIEPPVAASLCSILAHQFKSRKLFVLKDILEILDNVGSIDAYLDDYYSFKKNLCTEFRNFSKASTLRSSPKISELLSQFDSKEVGIITTNWDSTFWRDSTFPNVVQLHGVCDMEESIILPSEFAGDEELAEVLDNLGYEIADENIANQVMRMFRGDFRRPVSAALHASSSWLRHAEIIVIWGLALHPYDAEVCDLIQGISPDENFVKKILVINPDKNAFDIAKTLLNSSFQLEHILN